MKVALSRNKWAYQIFPSQNKAHKYAVSMFPLISVVGLTQSFPTCKDFFTDASYRSGLQHRPSTGFNWPLSISENWKFHRTVPHGEFPLRTSLWLLWPLHLETSPCLQDGHRKTCIPLTLGNILTTIYGQIMFFWSNMDHKAQNKVNMHVHYHLKLEQHIHRENVKCSISLYQKNANIPSCNRKLKML